MANHKTIPMCSKCGMNPRAFPESTNPWCKACLTTYHAEYTVSRKNRENGKDFTDGVEAMRRELCAALMRPPMHPASMLRVKETLDWIAGFPAPRP